VLSLTPPKPAKERNNLFGGPLALGACVRKRCTCKRNHQSVTICIYMPAVVTATISTHAVLQPYTYMHAMTTSTPRSSARGSCSKPCAIADATQTSQRAGMHAAWSRSSTSVGHCD
jgi:hypothetical protein